MAESIVAELRDRGELVMVVHLAPWASEAGYTRDGRSLVLKRKTIDPPLTVPGVRGFPGPNMMSASDDDGECE